MVGFNRREFLSIGSMAMVGLAGCSTSDAGDDGNQDDEAEREEVMSGTWEIEEDEYRYWELPINEDVNFEYSFSVNEGPEIESVLMDDRAFSHFEERESYQYYPEGSVPGAISNSVEVSLEAGDYVLIFDNTDRGEVQPPADFDNNVARVEIQGYVSPI